MVLTGWTDSGVAVGSLTWEERSSVPPLQSAAHEFLLFLDLPFPEKCKYGLKNYKSNVQW